MRHEEGYPPLPLINGKLSLFQMLFLLTTLCISLKPIVLLAGVYGSNLFATHREFSKLWYCPASMDHELFWVDFRYAVPPFHNCLLELLRCQYDPKTGKVGSMPGVHIDVGDFGGSGGISHVDKGFGDWHLIESLNDMIEYFKSMGYTLRKDLLGVPYDWRLTLVGLDALWPRMTKLIERAYTRNGNQKVTMLGYSNGAMVVQHFLNEVCSSEWRQKYVDKVIYLAPGYAGAGSAVSAAWNKVFPLFPFIRSDGLEDSIESMPVIHAQFPNFEVFKDVPVITGPYGKEYFPREFPELLHEHKKVLNESYLIMKQSFGVLETPPKDHGMPTYIIYNSQITTPFGLKFRTSWDETPESVRMPGDGTITAQAVEYPCKHWSRNNGAPLICHNVNRSAPAFSHQLLSTNKEIIAKIFDLHNTTWEEWE